MYTQKNIHDNMYRKQKSCLGGKERKGGKTNTQRIIDNTLFTQQKYPWQSIIQFSIYRKPKNVERTIDRYKAVLRIGKRWQ
mmetsp:Transcript_25724/g.37737  ORF Transcript_25724/g.37737 Transcript_25724/m.37737 type:complete len:81 (+) Transcript_25724:340-582(+)